MEYFLPQESLERHFQIDIGHMLIQAFHLKQPNQWIIGYYEVTTLHYIFS